MLQSFFVTSEEVTSYSKSSIENKTVNRAEFAIHALLLLERIPRDLADANDAFEQLTDDDASGSIHVREQDPTYVPLP